MQLPPKFSRPLEARMRRVPANLHGPTIRSTQTVDQITVQMATTKIILAVTILRYHWLLSSVLRWELWSSLDCSSSFGSDEGTRVGVRGGWEYGNGRTTNDPLWATAPLWSTALLWATAQVGVKHDSLITMSVNPCTRTTSSQHHLSIRVHGPVQLFLTMEITPQYRPQTRLRSTYPRPLCPPHQITNNARKPNKGVKGLIGNLVTPTLHHHHPWRRRSTHRAPIRARRHPQGSEWHTTPTWRPPLRTLTLSGHRQISAPACTATVDRVTPRIRRISLPRHKEARTVPMCKGTLPARKLPRRDERRGVLSRHRRLVMLLPCTSMRTLKVLLNSRLRTATTPLLRPLFHHHLSQDNAYITCTFYRNTSVQNASLVIGIAVDLYFAARGRVSLWTQFPLLTCFDASCRAITKTLTRPASERVEFDLARVCRATSLTGA